MWGLTEIKDKLLNELLKLKTGNDLIDGTLLPFITFAYGLKKMSAPVLKIISGVRLARQTARSLSAVSKVTDVETHTGQKYDKDDFRNIRFVDKPKHVNKNFAIKLISEIPPIEVETRTTYCDGDGNGALGHPRVFINLDKPGPQSCLYCGLRYVQKPHGH